MSWWELYRAFKPDDIDLVSSRNTPGSFRGYFLGDNGILGQAEFSKVDLRKVLAIGAPILLATGFIGGVAAAPRIRRWWGDEALPAARTGWKWITRQDQVAAPGVPTAAAEAFCREVDVALEGSRASISSAESQQYLLEILMAAAIIADRMRTLSNADVEDDASLPELKIAMQKLTAREVTNTINQMLTAEVSILDNETSELFAKIFGGGHVVDGEYVPLTNDKIKDVLSLDSPRDDS
uniref:hypothetical protein n=1 Tax=Paractinoplanes polyasparticus TaxID=2856853 RepID=UPI001C85C649|nr:hypothetical protein [Actinoplanes polyasparticus]